MTEFLLTPMVLFRVVAFTLGLTITGIGFNAYRRTRTAYLHRATIGFGIVTPISAEERSVPRPE